MRMRNYKMKQFVCEDSNKMVTLLISAMKLRKGLRIVNAMRMRMTHHG